MKVMRFRKAVDIALILALVVVMLGAYTRLTDAGLGCPDWPGCYGHLIVQNQAEDQALSMTQLKYNISVVEPRKAWTEMVHRYAAGTLALLIFFIGIQSIRQRRQERKLYASQALTQPCFFPLLLMVLVVFQALLGMWTVTLKLLPIVVMGHLLGGILIFSSLASLRLQLSPKFHHALGRWRLAIGIALVLVFCQIALGGWVSANYAGISCVGFPQCNGQWLPTLYFAKGFNLFSPVGENYQGGLLENSIRVTIQYIHRIGAVLTASYLLVLAGLLLKKVLNCRVRILTIGIIILVLLQFCVGVINVLYRLPLTAAVAHNGLAALLMASVLMLFSMSCSGKKA